MAREHKRTRISRRDLLVGAMSVGAAAALARPAKAEGRAPRAAKAGSRVVKDRMVARSSHSISDIEPGWALLAGGLINKRPTKSALLIDTVSGELRRVSPMLSARARHASLTLSDGRVLVMGGVNGRYLGSVEAYDPMSNTWTRLRKLSIPRADFAVVEVAGGVLVTGGTGKGGPVANELYLI